MRFLYKKKILLAELQRSWWAVLTILFSFLVFQQAMYKKDEEYKQLHKRYENFLVQKNFLEKENYELSLEIRSQSDPEYIELTLKKVLGLVPEGEQKVFFDNNP
ncbi:MAG: hypothetical protein Tsb0015_09200 [Simkaniaceae bacterium]